MKEMCSSQECVAEWRDNGLKERLRLGMRSSPKQSKLPGVCAGSVIGSFQALSFSSHEKHELISELIVLWGPRDPFQPELSSDPTITLTLAVHSASPTGEMNLTGALLPNAPLSCCLPPEKTSYPLVRGTQCCVIVASCCKVACRF